MENCGEICFMAKEIKKSPSLFLGEFECTLDDKGRILMPSALLKQFHSSLRKKFIINRSVFQKCLVLFATDGWEEIASDLLKLNRFNKENDDFIRQYTNGAIILEADASNRLLLPKRLLDYAKIDRDIILTASLNKIEMWSAKVYNDVMKKYDSEKFAALAEKVMSKQGGGNV